MVRFLSKSITIYLRLKDDVMRTAVSVKFSRTLDIENILLNIGKQKIIESTTADYYWGVELKKQVKTC